MYSEGGGIDSVVARVCDRAISKYLYHSQPFRERRGFDRTREKGKAEKGKLSF